MSSKRRVKRKQCERKVAYPSEYMASLACDNLRKQGEIAVHVYSCLFCRKWHVGHSNRFDEQGMNHKFRRY